MKNLQALFILLAGMVILAGCVKKIPEKKGADMNRVSAWCIVPFDSMHRTPAERIAMLKELGFQSYAYDWRAGHLPEMEMEWQLAKENGIEVIAVWLWIDENSDQPGKLSESNEAVLGKIKDTGLETQLWVGFHANYFDSLSHEEAIQRGVEMVTYLAERARELNCKVALYNHGDWFGEPENEVAIIKNIPSEEIGIIYNFHHAHEQINRFPEIVQTMLPYIWRVNLNGMKKEGPKILPLGTGDYEKQMFTTLKEAGYTGPYGILGHVENADVKLILEKNLEGYRMLMEN